MQVHLIAEFLSSHVEVMDKSGRKMCLNNCKGETILFEAMSLDSLQGHCTAPPPFHLTGRH